MVPRSAGRGDEHERAMQDMKIRGCNLFVQEIISPEGKKSYKLQRTILGKGGCVLPLLPHIVFDACAS